MPVEHVPADTGADKIHEILRRDACIIIDGLGSTELLDRVEAEMAPHEQANHFGPEEFTGVCTKRTGALVARSPAARELVMHPTILDTTKQLLHDAANFHLHLTQIISIGPGETAQPIHRDQWAFDFFPFPTGYEVQCNTLWAITDFTDENGATRVIPGSHEFEDKLRLDHDQTEPAEMEKGSVLLYTGAIYHGGGANRSDAVRKGVNITYARAWLTQEENQFLAVPHEVARELPKELLALLGYAPAAYALNYYRDLEPAITAIHPRRSGRGF
ncbi:MAG: phytanoyl-CoA dioxygenase family protein [Myxococcales bacterium]|nr:phytanoyl-CoA dioxygenase family protein [Myxococcales bacterium]